MPGGMRALTMARVQTTPWSLIDLDPVVVLDADEVGVLVVHPDRIAAARQRLHAQRVAVGRVDVPLAVRGEVVQHDAAGALVGLLQVARLAEFAARLERRQVLAEGDVGLVVEIEMLPAGERAPRDQLLDVLAVGRVGALAVGDARPDTAWSACGSGWVQRSSNV